MALKVCVITGGRADYGLLTMPMRAILSEPKLHLQLIATGQHLANDGETLRQIERDGFTIDAVVDMQLSNDRPEQLIASTGHELLGLSRHLQVLQPEIILVLGDRYEILAAVLASVVAGIPVAHLCGGDITEGAFDDAIRHAITKLSHLHFPTNADAAARIVQMGEEPKRVHIVGSSGIDAIRAIKPLPREDFFRSMDLADRSPTFLITLHPATLSENEEHMATEMLAALGAFDLRANFLFTGVNADPGASLIDKQIQAFCASRPKAARFRQSLGAKLYFSAMRHADVVVGNSSSGLYEAPSFSIPTVNIGDRQSGRLKAISVFDCAADRKSVRSALDAALAFGRQAVDNPYGEGNASAAIVEVLRQVAEPKALLHKRFISGEIA